MNDFGGINAEGFSVTLEHSGFECSLYQRRGLSVQLPRPISTQENKQGIGTGRNKIEPADGLCIGYQFSVPV
jgi:hypothetical protein